jgi:hypothetical protein
VQLILILIRVSESDPPNSDSQFHTEYNGMEWTKGTLVPCALLCRSFPFLRLYDYRFEVESWKVLFFVNGSV